MGKQPSPGLALASPVDLMKLAKVEPPSPAIESILQAAYACPPTSEQAKDWEGLSGAPWPKKAPRKVIACVGRRGLKTSGIIAWTCVFEALAGGHESHAMQGSRVYFVVVSPEQRQAREAVRAIRAVLDQLKSIGVEYSVRDPAGCTEITITRPIVACERVITVMTSDAVAVRGFAIAFAALDEVGFLPSEPHLAVRDVDVYGALVPGMVQFPNAKQVFASTPGPSQGLFFDLVNKPPTDSILVRAPTWVTNPRISEKQCGEIAKDDRHYQQEFGAARFGALNESFLDEDLVRACVDPEVEKGPREGSFVIGLDVGLVHDSTAICVASCRFEEIPGSSPVVHIAIEHLEEHKGSKIAPLSLDRVLDRVAALSHAYRKAVVSHDAHEGSETDRGLKSRGVRGIQMSMAPHAQTDRWALLSDLIHGRRLHIPSNPELIKQLAALRVTQLSSGALRVEGRKDDLADAVALACEQARKLPPTGGTINFDYGGGRHWDPERKELSGAGKRWYRKLPNGSKDFNVEPPVGTLEFEKHVKTLLAQGLKTPATEKWLKDRADSRVTVRVITG